MKALYEVVIPGILGLVLGLTLPLPPLQKTSVVVDVQTPKGDYGTGHLVCPNCHTCIGHVTTVKSSLSNGEQDIEREHTYLLEKKIKH